MRYKKFTVKTKPEAEDILCAELNGAGIMSLEIEDSVPFTEKELQEIFVDEIPVRDIPEGVAYVSFYLGEDEDEEKILQSVREVIEELRGCMDIGEGSISRIITEDADWQDRWKEFFKPFSIGLYDGRKLDIVPSWEKADSENKNGFLLNIDPGTAFGTGAHETTKLCIKELSRYVKKGSRVLDLGTGSGILSMVSFMFGAAEVTATEVDINAKPAIEDNFKKNDLEGADFRLIFGDVVKDGEIRKKAGTGYDVIVANILPVVLIPLSEVIKEFAKEGSVIIFSGILTEKADGVRQALKKEGIRIDHEDTKGEWSSITAIIGD